MFTPSCPRKATRILCLEPLEDRCVLSGDVVLHWNQLALDAIRQVKPNPLVASRALAIEQVAVYDSQAAPSYYSYAETERHYGLGDRKAVDVEVEFYPSGKKVRVKDVKANTTVKVPEDNR